ncbi:MAG: hypothetical protein Q8N63_09145 [Nanoarchaeota archaeon]|nr:hypothetical protein [Nanoarchaeota archaeon]
MQIEKECPNPDCGRTFEDLKKKKCSCGTVLRTKRVQGASNHHNENGHRRPRSAISRRM